MDRLNNKVIPNASALRKMIMQESGGRLTSFNLPRDLTLGGTKSKKVFTPNLNVVRNKHKGKIMIEPTKPKRRHKPNTGFKRIAKPSSLVQSDGVFSQGMGERKRRRSNIERARTTRSYSTAAVAAAPILIRPTIKKGWNSINKDEEQLVVDNLLRHEDTDSDSDQRGYPSITLPLELSKNKPSTITKPQAVLGHIKTEVPAETVHDNSSILDLKPIVKVEKSEPNETLYTSFLNTSKVYDNDNPAFAVIKLPDSLPGKAWKEPPDKNDDVSFFDMNDGFVGKIQIRKSGKIELVVRNTTYSLSAEDAGKTLTTAILFPGSESISMEPSLVTVGAIQETISISPQWGNLFDEAKKNPKFLI